MFRSLQWKLVGIFVSFAIVLIVVVGVVLNFSVQVSYYNSFKNDIESGFSNWLLEKNWDIADMSGVSVSEMALLLAEKPEERYNFRLISENRSYTVIDNSKDTSGSRLYASSDKYYDRNAGDQFWFMIARSENLVTVMAGDGRGNSSGLIRSGGAVFFDYAVSVKLIEGSYILYFRYDKDDWEGIIKTFNSMIFMSLLAAVAVSLFLGFILSKTITRPIAGLMVNTRKMAAGDFEDTLEAKSRDEIGELTRAFNHMGSELKFMMGEISSQKIRLETILKYMTDGVIAYDLKGGIMHINPAALNLIDDGYEKASFNEFSAKYNLGITIEDILYLNKVKGGEKTVRSSRGDRYIRIYYALFIDEENNVQGVVVVMHDATEQQMLDDMRREFVGNVSHELNTPLTCIKSYSETLLDGALEDRETAGKFINVIYSESDRMTRLVKDLLLLSSIDNQKNIENGRIKLKKETIDFEKLVRNCVERIEIEARNKEITIETFTLGSIPSITADMDKIEQVVLNILSNAYKYTHPGGKVTVYIGTLYSDVYTKVIDTGVGIPEGDLPHVFERFYRVDKARSREMGGTGLGLAIAKEITEAHGGEIIINSNKGKGTEVTVKLPIEQQSDSVNQS